MLFFPFESRLYTIVLLDPSTVAAAVASPARYECPGEGGTILVAWNKRFPAEVLETGQEMGN